MKKHGGTTWPVVLIMYTFLATNQAAGQPPPPKPFDLTVVCLDEAGRPVYGAEVFCVDYPFTRYPIPTDIRETVLKGQTDRSGACTFKNLDGNVYQLLHARWDSIGAWGRADYDGKQPVQRLELKLTEGISAVGHVYDTNERPLANVTILYKGLLLVWTTGEDGRYELPNLSEDRVGVGLLVDGYAYDSETCELSTHAPAAFLKPEAVVEGTVSDAEGRPVEGAFVRCQPFVAVTNAHGYYRIGSLQPSDPQAFPPSERTRSVSAERFEGEKCVSASTRIFLEQAVNRVDLCLQPPESYQTASLSGRVVFGDRVDSLAGKVCLESREQGIAWDPIPIQPDGSFASEKHSPGTFYLTARLEDPVLIPKKAVPVELKDGQDLTGIVLELEESCALRGSITKAGGTPARDVVLRLAMPENSFLDERSDRDGRFLFAHLPGHETAYTLHVDIPGCGFSITTPTTIRGEIVDIPPIQLPDMVSVAGEVTDTAGKPVVGADVTIHHSDSPSGVRTDAKGRFRCEFPRPKAKNVAVSISLSPVATLRYFGPSYKTNWDPAPTVDVLKGGVLSLEPDENIEGWPVVVRITLDAR